MEQIIVAGVVLIVIMAYFLIGFIVTAKFAKIDDPTAEAISKKASMVIYHAIWWPVIAMMYFERKKTLPKGG